MFFLIYIYILIKIFIFRDCFIPYLCKFAEAVAFWSNLNDYH